VRPETQAPGPAIGGGLEMVRNMNYVAVFVISQD
jgi:hypothetical protein